MLRAAEPPAPATIDLVAEEGPVEAARLIRDGRATDAVADECRTSMPWSCAERDLTLAAETGMRLVIPEDEEWPCEPGSSPALLHQPAHDPEVSPLGLWVRGQQPLRDLLRRSITITGSRASTGYGNHVAVDLSYQLASRQVTVVSGASYGIDGDAHRGALAAHAATVAVLACGVDIDDPSGHRTLLGSIAESGLVVSEYPPGTPASRARFLARNRLLATLPTAGVIIVEAGHRGGARHVAGLATRTGRRVFAVPGPITSATSAGTHQLIRDGATLITGPDDVLSEIDTPAKLGSAPR
ncbi:DNA-protecting protein DprA [Saccharothrix sp. AJ9571]|nr:DNA-protecting protein DprA [Saccharothrix sp. AJ9571]